MSSLMISTRHAPHIHGDSGRRTTRSEVSVGFLQYSFFSALSSQLASFSPLPCCRDPTLNDIALFSLRWGGMRRFSSQCASISVMLWGI
eukprot:1154230-Pelagomonas_calceolata.AAC.2